MQVFFMKQSIKDKQLIFSEGNFLFSIDQCVCKKQEGIIKEHKPRRAPRYSIHLKVWQRPKEWSREEQIRMCRNIRDDVNECTHHLPDRALEYKEYNTEQNKKNNDTMAYVIERRRKCKHRKRVWLRGFVRRSKFPKTCLPSYCLPHDPHKRNRERKKVGENAPNNSPPYRDAALSEPLRFLWRIDRLCGSSRP